MSDKLRKLAEQWRATAKRLPGGDYAVAHEVCADELLSILDAEGDGGAVPVAQVSQSMVHEAMAHVPFAMANPAKWQWIANHLNNSMADPDKVCECCGVTPAGDIPGDAPTAEPVAQAGADGGVGIDCVSHSPDAADSGRVGDAKWIAKAIPLLKAAVSWMPTKKCAMHIREIDALLRAAPSAPEGGEVDRG